MPTPGKVIVNSEGEGVSKAKIFKGEYEAKLESPGGWGGGSSHKTFRGGGMDIFWNHNSFSVSMLAVIFYVILIPRAPWFFLCAGNE